MDDKEYKKIYSKETYEWRKAHKICVRCGKEDAEPGITFCLVCKMDERERSLKYYETLPEEDKAAMLKRKRSNYHERRTNGLCVKCGQYSNGKALCEKHREKAKWYQHRRYLKMQSIAVEVE